MLTVKLNSKRDVSGENVPGVMAGAFHQGSVAVPVAADGHSPVWRYDTLILEAKEVVVRTLRPRELKEVEVRFHDHKADCPSNRAFYLTPDGQPPKDGSIVCELGSDGFFYSAFIENSNGKTTESVQF